MDKRRPIQARIRTGNERPGDAEARAEAFKEALARWATTVTVFAVRGRDGRTVHATTATSFAPIAAQPPSVVVSLSPNAQALPFVQVGGTGGISLLAEGQGTWASMFAESYPVGAQPWSEEGAPQIPGPSLRWSAPSRLSIRPVEGAGWSCARSTSSRWEKRPVLCFYWQRAYRRLEQE